MTGVFVDPGEVPFARNYARSSRFKATLGSLDLMSSIDSQDHLWKIMFGHDTFDNSSIFKVVDHDTVARWSIMILSKSAAWGKIRRGPLGNVE